MNKLLIFIFLSIFIFPSAFAKTDKICSHLKEMENFNESEILQLQETYGNTYVELFRLAYPEKKDTLKKIDEVKKTSWLEQEIYVNIAECYLQGNHVEQDIEKGKLYLSKAAKSGNYGAAHQLASIQLFSSDNPEEKKQGFKHLELEYKNGSAYSAGKLGWAYQQGVGTKKDISKAKEFYEFAAKNGMTYWQFLLAHAYKMGYLGYDIDPVKSKYWLDFKPKIHVDSYECWVVNYYNDGIFPKNKKELKLNTKVCDNYNAEQNVK